MPAQTEAASDWIIGRVNEVALGRHFAGKGEAAGEKKREQKQGAAVQVCHHFFPGKDAWAQATAEEVAMTN